MGGKLGQLDVTYRQYSKINTAYQRSSFWKKEYGVVLNRNGSARMIRGNEYDVPMNIRPRDGEYATAHTHWAKDGIDLGGGKYTVGGYHSSQDFTIQGYSMVVGRTTSTYSIHGTNVYHYINPDPFVRYFLFPFLSLK
jgi:D-lyxose ketol-isomerase